MPWRPVLDTQLLRQHGEAALRGIPEQTPLGRLGEPEDIAGVIAGLCSGEYAWINGQNIFANGGPSESKAPELRSGGF